MKYTFVIDLLRYFKGQNYVEIKTKRHLQDVLSRYECLLYRKSSRKLILTGYSEQNVITGSLE